MYEVTWTDEQYAAFDAKCLEEAEEFEDQLTSAVMDCFAVMEDWNTVAGHYSRLIEEAKRQGNEGDADWFRCLYDRVCEFVPETVKGGV